MRGIRLAVAAAVISVLVGGRAGARRRPSRAGTGDVDNGPQETSAGPGAGGQGGSLPLGGNYQHLLRFSHLSSVGVLAGSLAHELNQPLTAIVSNAQAAHEYLDAGIPDAAEMREILDDVARDACRAAATIRRIRALFKGEPMQVQPFDVADVIDEVITLVQGNALGRGIRLWQRVDRPLPRVSGDPLQIQQVLLNLLLNALEATEAAQPGVPRGDVSVLAEARNGLVHVCVCDRGCGVADAELENIFQPFVTFKPQGMGLGLAISRAIAQRHGGCLKGWNNEDGGMTFRLSLPQENPLPAARVPAATAVAGQATPSDGEHSGRIEGASLFR